MATNFYTVKKEIKGKVYTAQFNGISAWYDAIDATYIDGTSTTSMAKLSKYVFENVIVEPKGLTANDFDNLEECQEVVNFGGQVARGEFREAKDEGAATKRSKE